jgi:lipoprotein-anchoring transpeptidase ErfK/SrfK
MPVADVSVRPRSRRGSAILIGSLVTLGAASGAVGAPAPTKTQTAEVLYPVAARKAPNASSAKAVQLVHYTSFSRGPNLLMVTATKPDDEGKIAWVQVQLPGRPNGRRAWVPREAVLLETTRYRVRVRVKSRKVELLRGGKVVKSFGAAVGTGGTPTPLGKWAIRDVFPAPGSPLGPKILVLTANSTVLQTFAGGKGEVAIHGWPDASVLGKAVSHGCVRLSQSSVAQISSKVGAGTPVDVVNT